MNKPKINGRKNTRNYAMLQAYLMFHSRKQPIAAREIACWLLLLEWAELGGKKDEVIA